MGFIRMAHRLQSNYYYNSSFLPVEGLRAQKLLSPQGWVSLQLFSTHQNPEEGGPNSSNGMNLPGRVKVST